MDKGMKGGETCRCSHHKVTPILVILFGLLFLGGNLEYIGMGFVGVVWPIMVIVVGGMKLMEKKCACC